MALRSGYKGIKKLAAGLKWNRPGVLAVDDITLENKIMDTIKPSVIANTELIKDTVGWSGKNKAEKIVVDNHKENNYTALFIDGDLQPNSVYKLQFSSSNGNVYYTNQYLFTSDINVTADGTKILTLTTNSTVSKSDATQYENGYGYKILKNRNAQSEFPAFSNVMIYDADILDDTYEPYFGSTAETILSDQKTAINAIITAATEAADFAAFKTAMGAITPVTRSLSREASPEEDPAEVIEEKPATRKTTTKKTTVKEGE